MINLQALEKQLKKYENKWIAISKDNAVLSSGKTYGEAVKKASAKPEAIFKVPPLHSYLAP